MLVNGKEMNLGPSGRSGGGGTSFAFKGWLVAAAVFWMVVAVVSLGLSSAAADISALLSVNLVDFATATVVFYNLALFGVAFTFYLPELRRGGVTVEKVLLLLCMAMAIVAAVISSISSSDSVTGLIEQAVAGQALTGVTQLLVLVPVFLTFRRLRPESGLLSGGFCVLVGIVGASFFFVGASFLNGTLEITTLGELESLANVLKASSVWLSLGSLLTIALAFFIPRLPSADVFDDGEANVNLDVLAKPREQAGDEPARGASASRPVPRTKAATKRTPTAKTPTRATGKAAAKTAGSTKPAGPRSPTRRK